MKLWWPHNEAMVATLLAYRVTREAKWWAWFRRVSEYTLAHFPDTPQNALVVPQPQALGGIRAAPAAMATSGGEWFGYLTREGCVSQRFKGGPYKGCFHVPRSLFLCAQILDEMLAVPS